MISKHTELTGKIRVTGKGVGYFPIPDADEDYEIQPEHIKTALNGDEVKVVPLNRENYGRKLAEVIEIIKRKKIDFVGAVEDPGSDHIFIVPDDRRMYKDIYVARNDSMKAEEGDKVQVHITEWKDTTKSPIGKILRIIGKEGEHNAEMAGIVYESGFEIDFPPEVEREADLWKEKFAKEDHLKDRKDFRSVTTFTIDPVDAKDFDDAISFQELPNGDFEVGVHIADVSHFVTEGSDLDIEAKKRGTSIYLVDRTIPMLPEVLSNDLCSLNPNEDKYTFSAVFIMNRNGEVKDRWFGKTLINSDKRFSYEEAQEILNNKEGIFYQELNSLNQIAYKLREEKFKKGAIEFETEEVRFELDEKGKPIRVYKKLRTDTHKLVEDFMLLANREVAKHMSDAGENTKAAFVYRIHDEPDRDRIINLAAFVKALGFELKNDEGKTTGEEIARMIRSVDGSPAEMLIKTAAIRSMSKAVYSTANIGHFGLAFKYYTHFTSPIRRYPDLLVHRFIYRQIKHGKIGQDEIAKYQHFSDEASEREIEASEAERASIKYKQVEYMAEKVGQEFDATVSGVSEWGVYVEEVNTRAEGMVKLRDMTNDFYELNEKLYAIVGKSSGKKFSLGDKVKVKLVAADPERKTLDFQFI
ncbi:MAG: ribonuclease R [Parcubacteria group bacterium]